MTLEAFQAFTTYWYAQAHGQFFVPPMAPFVPPLAQPTIKLSKLVKKVRQLGCETFSSTVDAITSKKLAKEGF